MGLDMYLSGSHFNSTLIKKKDGSFEERDRPLLDDKYPIESSDILLGYWRKHADLHGMIVETFADGVDECQEIHLDSSDCHRIADALRNNGLPDNEDCGGFFFGSPEFWDDYMVEAEDHARVFDKAAAWIESNSWNSVTYQASW